MRQVEWDHIRLYRLLRSLLVLSLIPLLIIACFDYPSADDFAMGAPAHLAFVQTHSIFAAVGQGFYMAWYDYMNWMGYFSSTFFMSLPFNIYSEKLYGVGVIALILLLVAAVAVFLRALLVVRLHVDRYVSGCISAITIFIMLQCMPEGMARVETFYWYCSGANYTLMFSLGLLWLALLLRLGAPPADGHDVAGAVPVVVECLLGFIVGGGNYMTALSCSMVAVCAILWALFRPSISRLLRMEMVTPPARPFSRAVLPCLFLLAGFAMSCLAPGNQVREEAVSGFGAIKTVLVALYYVLSYCVSRWTTWPVLILLIVLAPLLWRAAGEAALSFGYPAIVMVLAWGFTGANIAPPLYALGNIEAGRLQSLFWLQYVLLLVLTEGYMLGWVRYHVLMNDTHDPVVEATVSRAAFRTMALAAAILVFGSVLQLKVDPHYYMSSSAVVSLADGSAAGYAMANRDRLMQLTSQGAIDVVLAPHEYRPELLFFSDITTDPDDWNNRGVARYYSLRSVVLSEAVSG